MWVVWRLLSLLTALLALGGLVNLPRQGIWLDAVIVGALSAAAVWLWQRAGRKSGSSTEDSESTPFLKRPHVLTGVISCGIGLLLLLPSSTQAPDDGHETVCQEAVRESNKAFQQVEDTPNSDLGTKAYFLDIATRIVINNPECGPPTAVALAQRIQERLAQGGDLTWILSQPE